MPSAQTRSVISGRPWVTVPVLSSATVRTPASRCNASPLRKSTPISAARPVPTMIEVGVASPIAQGQAMISTDTPATSASVSAGSGPITSHTATVSAATAMTAGTNHSVIRSTSPWIGSLAPCASSTMRMICASVVSAPTRVARNCRLPAPATVPPVSASPGPLATGTGSPVIMLSSTRAVPSVTSPSTGIRSPGRTRTISPGVMASISTSCGVPSRITRAVRDRRPISRSIAAPVRPLARASSQRPSRISTTITAAASK